MERTPVRLVVAALGVVGLVALGGCSGSSRPIGDTGEVTGTTVEERIFTPVEGARVEIGGQTATTGAGGAFTVSGVPKGEQKLTVAGAGYLPFATTVQVDPGANDVGALWLKRAQMDGGGDDGGAGDGPPPDDAREDAGQTDVLLDVAQTDVLEDVAQTDVLEDVAQTDVMQDVGQSDVMQDHLQSDVMQDSAAPRTCGTLGLTGNPVWPGTPIDSATFAGASLTAPHASTTCTAGGAGPEHVYWYHHDHVADLVWEVTQSNWNVVAYVRQDCDGLDGGGTPIADPACADQAGASMETAVWRDAPAGDYYFFVDGVAAGDVGAYQAKLTVREIHGAGQSCDGITARCQAGLTCQGGLCYTIASWCGSHAVDTLQLGVPGNGNTTAATNSLQCNAVGNDKDQFWRFTADGAGGLYNVRVTSPDHSLYIYHTADCTSSAATTGCTGSGSARDENFDLTLAPNQTTYLVVDGYTGSSGAYTITIDRVQLHNLTDACDPFQQRLSRCIPGAYCDETSHCAAVMTETEDNNSAANANAATSGRPIVGAKSTATDVDWFSIGATAGDIVVAQTLDGATDRCSDLGLDSRLRVFAAGDLVNPIAMNDDALGNYCSFVIAPITVTGTYYVALDHYAGGTGTFDYTLRIWVRTPAVVAEAAGVNDTAAAAQGVSLPVYLDGALDPANVTTPDAVDWYKFAVPLGYRTFVHAYDAAGTACAVPDDRLALYQPDGTSVIDTTSVHCDLAFAGLAPAAGTYYARITPGATVAFGYRLLVFSLPW